jgi:hypothetical protein
MIAYKLIMTFLVSANVQTRQIGILRAKDCVNATHSRWLEEVASGADHESLGPACQRHV